ncbi:hypothetical protein [Bacteroides sp. 51]|uniref:hypothetical protein n=1 Tax=Bacteroides sp. 51 TaxID=2302938 RepID=UPI0013D5E956|nr:hypothetical protein [Bacteroides sp. 51]NDV84412.1 hypothetical protein [Bacteroides sp. 51]
MKICPNCREEVEDNFDLCWNCCYSFSEEQIISLPEKNSNTEIKCLRCHVPMIYSGEYKFLEGTRLGVLGDFFELLQNREAFDLYLCPKCGKVEFFSPLKKK